MWGAIPERDREQETIYLGRGTIGIGS